MESEAEQREGALRRERINRVRAEADAMGFGDLSVKVLSPSTARCDPENFDRVTTERAALFARMGTPASIRGSKPRPR